MADPHGSSIVVTSIGMESSLGNARTACAAERAGISLARTLDECTILAADGDELAVTVHPVEAAAGFQGVGKLATLARSALRDLLVTVGAANLPRGRMGFCLAAPSAPLEPDGTTPSWETRTLAARMARESGLEITDADIVACEGETGGFAAALRSALEALRSNRWQCALVGATDSLLEADTIAWLDENDRLKTQERPDGLRPGEAAAFLLLERRDEAERRGATALAEVRGCEISVEAEGDGAGAAMARALSAIAEGDTASTFWLISDHNGETSSADALGHAMVRLALGAPQVADAPRSFPAASFGDTGEAAGAVATCVAVAAFTRAYALGASALVSVSQSAGGSAAIRLDGMGQ